MTRTVFDNAMTAHVWAQRTQDSGRSGNGNFYFEGAFLYSYGSHFLVGYALPDGRALLNSDSNSVSTNRQKRWAARAVRGRSVYVPGLTGFRDILDGAERDAQRVTGQTPEQEAASRARRVAQALDMIQRKAPDTKKGAPINERARPGFAPFTQEAAALILEALGLPAAKAGRMAARAIKTRETNRAKWKAATEAAKLQAALDLAKSTAARPLADLQAEMRALERSGNLNARLHVPQWETRARALHEAAKAAKAKGWARVAESVMTHYRAIRAAVKSWPELEGPAEVRAELRKAFGMIRAARAFIAMPVRALGKAESEFPWHRKPTRAAADAMIALAQLGLVPGGSSRALVAALTRYWGFMGFPATVAIANAAELATAIEAMRARAEAASNRETTYARVAALRTYRAELARDGEAIAAHIATRAQRAAMGAVNDSRVWLAAGWTEDALRAQMDGIERVRTATVIRDLAARQALESEWNAARRAAWLACERAPEWNPDLPRPYVQSLTDSEGGALVRAVRVQRDAAGVITGGTLETSQGAEVPLTHAIRAFRFLKLCREKAASDPTFDGWKANGKALPVGLFRVDSVDREGNFRAGCHRINWGEVARLAAELGLSDMAPANTTEATPGH